MRWSEYVSLDDESAALTWWEVVDRRAGERPDIRDLRPCRGELDAVTAAALADAVGDLELTCFRWTGYGGSAVAGDSVRVMGNDFVRAPLRRTDLRAGEWLPEFAWDDGGTLAWGARLYPDSLIVAGDLERVQRLHADPRVDTIAVRPATDPLPLSSGD